MLTWANYRFKQTIKHQANIRNVSVIDVTEEYTSIALESAKVSFLWQPVSGGKFKATQLLSTIDSIVPTIIDNFSIDY
jgi:hypothetical protein